MKIHALALALVIGLGLVTACAPGWKQMPHDQLFQAEGPIRLVKSPAGRSPSDWWDRAYLSAFRPLGRGLSPGYFARGFVGGRAAQDVNRFGQVPDSGWFVNRIGRHAVSIERTALGAAGDDGPAPGDLLVISGKLEGVSSGFTVRDSAGTTWFLKLDHPAFPELSTSAEVISSRLLWLAGYWVPSMHAIDLDRSRIVLDPTARRRNRYNAKVPMTQADLSALLTLTNPDKAGRFRALVSRQPFGEVLGPWDYHSRRLDDPNDVIEHEHRRSLRGLWLFAAWVNNPDTRNANTLDMFVPVSSDGRGVVQHYLIDFGDALGSTGTGEKALSEGYQYVTDWTEMGKNLFTFGLRYPSWQGGERSEFRSVGLFESTTFVAEDWTPAYPNPAFEERTRADELWAASILARIQPEHIRAAVTAGKYREEGAAAYVEAQLLGRRAKLLEYAFRGQITADRPRVDGDTLILDDLRALGGLPARGPINYTIRWNRTAGRDHVLARGTLTHPADRPHEFVIDLAPTVAALRPAGTRFTGDPFITVKLSRKHVPSTSIHLRRVGDAWIPVGVDR